MNSNTRANHNFICKSNIYALQKHIYHPISEHNYPTLGMSESGIVERKDATVKIRSVYFRDSHGTLLKVSYYIVQHSNKNA